MTRKLTRAQLVALAPCDLDRRLALSGLFLEVFG